MHLPTLRNKYLDTFAHTFLSRAARAPAGEARRRAVLHRRQQPAVPDHPRRRASRRSSTSTASTRDRSKWPRAGQGLPALRRAQRAALGRHGASPTRTRSRRSSSSRYGRRIGVVPYGVEDPGDDGHRDARAPRASSRATTCCSSGAWSRRTTRTCSSRRSRASPASARAGMKLVVVGGAPYADEYIRRSMRERRPARDLPRLRLRRAATGSCSATPTCSARRPRSAARTR